MTERTAGRSRSPRDRDATAAPRTADEQSRLASVWASGLLEPASDDLFDTVTQLVAAAFNLPVALVTVVDEEQQWVKSQVGELAAEVHREVSFCSHAILEPDEVMVVEDASADRRFADNPLVTGSAGIRFYAGAPVRGPGGWPIGTVCVFDSVARRFEPAQRRLLRRAAAQVERILTVHAEREAAEDETRRVRLMHSELEQAISDRRSFLAFAQHKLKTPLTVVDGWSRTLQRWEDFTDDERRSGLESIHRAARELRSRIDDLLDEARSQLLEQTLDVRPIPVLHFVEDLMQEMQLDPSVFPLDVRIDPDITLLADPEALRQVVSHLVDNATKYSPDGGGITIAAERSGTNVVLRISDHGIGLPDDADIFEPFRRGHDASTVARGTGLGLYIVQSLVGKMQGVVAAVGEPDGTTIEVILPGV